MSKFSLALKKQRRLAELNQLEACQIIGMDLSAYRKYEQGRVLPSNLSMACGMLTDLGMSIEEANRRFRPHIVKPLKVAEFAISKREEALIQWFDQQFEQCINTKKPLARFAVLVLFFQNKIGVSSWVKWKHHADMIRWLATKNVTYTKQTAHTLDKKIAASFHDMCSSIDAV